MFSAVKLEHIRVKLNFVGCTSVDRIELGGGLTLFWKEGTVVNFNSPSPGHINARVVFPNCKPMRFTRFYGNSELYLKDNHGSY